MDSNITVNRKVILIQFFVVLLTTRLVGADLPSGDIMRSTSCLRQYVGDSFLAAGYREGALTDGEYIGVMCKDTSEDTLALLIGKRAANEEVAKAIKKCLAETNSEDLFKKYIELGRRLTAPGHETSSSKQDDFPKGSDTRQKASPLYTSSYSTVVIFANGICRSLIQFEPTDFDQLTNEKDKKETLKCLINCTRTFIHRIKYWLTDTRSKLIKSDILKDEEEIEQLEKTPHPSMEFTAMRYYSKFEKAKEPLNVNLITQVGKQYLITYSKLDCTLVKHIPTEDKKSDFSLKFLNDNLYDTYYLYETCASLGCGMNSNSTPLYDVIKAGTDNNNSVVLQPFENDPEDIKKYVSSNIETWRGFCMAFVTSTKKD